MQQPTFIENVCRWVLEHHAGHLHNVTVVVPARRSMRFFTNRFVSLLMDTQTTSVLPRLLTLNDLTDQVSPYTTISPVEQVFYFYEVYCKLEKDPEPFEKFYTWAPALLADFNEIDNYMLDADVLFTDLRNIKEIDEWSFNATELSPGQQRLNTFWLKIPKYYYAFREFLSAKDLAYNGMANKYIAENANEVFPREQGHIYVFAGFNALTQCEKILMQFLAIQRGGALFFDADNYYVADRSHEAGLFLRQYQQWFGGAFNAFDADMLAGQPKNIFYHACNGEALQCSSLVNILDHTPAEQLQNSAIVLCNEQLLPVLIGQFPPGVLNINVTMGWPLRFTNASDFFTGLIDIHIAALRNRNYIPLETIRHFNASASFFIRHNSTFALNEITNLQNLQAYYEGTGIYPLLAVKGHSVMQFIHAASAFLKNEMDTRTISDLNLEIAAHYYEVFNKLALLPGIEAHVQSWYIFKQLFQKFTRNYPLAFVGEPMSGIQVMGMLETRALDFENVYILSANEGFLPAQNTSNSFIPYELRQHVKLPGKPEQDAVFAYYFYRLIQRARNVHVFYNGQSELLQQAEKSRYLLQVEKELTELNPAISFRQYQVNPVAETIPGKQAVQKTAFYISTLEAVSQNGFSASMLSAYAKCPLDFYYKYILGFKQQKDPEFVDESDIGNIIHAFFDRLFKPYQGQILTSEIFAEGQKLYKTYVHEEAKEKFRRYDFTSGHNYLALQMVYKMITTFLQKQMAPGPYSLAGKILVGTELPLQANITLESGQPMVLRGNIDLLLKDEGDIYYVYDFKTGRADEEDLRLGKMQASPMAWIATHEKFLQLSIYKRLVRANYNVLGIHAYIIPLAMGSVKLMPPDADAATEAQLINAFLTDAYAEMHNTAVPLEHNAKSRFCEFCDV